MYQYRQCKEEDIRDLQNAHLDASHGCEFKLTCALRSRCEGYDSPDDPYILKGSCGVEYRLILTSLGEEKYGARSEPAWKSSSRKGEGGLSDSVATTLFVGSTHVPRT